MYSIVGASVACFTNSFSLAIIAMDHLNLTYSVGDAVEAMKQLLHHKPYDWPGIAVCDHSSDVSGVGVTCKPKF